MGARQPAERSGGRILVDALVALGASRAFCVAGESYLEVLDAALDRPELHLVTCRQEGGAAFMAEADGKLTGRPGLCLVTRGPGACNAAIGVHTAMQDSTPMILLVGQVARDQRDREAFQEIDLKAMFTPVAKWAAQIDQAARIPEYLARAWRTACSGRPGPVVLALPEDMLRERAAVADPRPVEIPHAHPGAAEMARLAGLLRQARRPLLLVGGGGWDDAACATLRQVAERWQIPVACSFRRQDILDNASTSYAGDLGTGPNPALVARVKAADLLLVLNARLGEMTTQGYSLVPVAAGDRTLVHVHAGPEELGRVYGPDLAIQSPPGSFLDAMQALTPPARPVWADWTAAARADWLAWQRPAGLGGDLDLADIFCTLRDRLPGDAIVTTDAGNFACWGQRYLRFGRPGRQLGPTSGAMGYGVPAAVAASLRHPDRTVLALCGDGGFQMTGQELASARQAGAKPLVLVLDNGLYGTIRMHQEMRFPGRVSATTLTNPDFVALARAHHAFAERVEKTADFAPALSAALASGRPALLHLPMDPDVISTTKRLSGRGRG